MPKTFVKGVLTDLSEQEWNSRYGPSRRNSGGTAIEMKRNGDGHFEFDSLTDDYYQKYDAGFRPFVIWYDHKYGFGAYDAALDYENGPDYVPGKKRHTSRRPPLALELLPIKQLLLTNGNGAKGKSVSMKTRQFQVKKLSDKGQGVAVIATLNVIDKDNDVTLPGAFGEQVVPMVPAHDWHSAPIGKATLHEEGDEVLADFQLNLETSLGRDWYEALKFDLNNPPPKQEFSYGFSVLEFDQGQFEGRPVRFLKSLKVHEISPVLLGAGVATRTLALKIASGKTGCTDASCLCPECIASKSARQKGAAPLDSFRYVESQDVPASGLKDFVSLAAKELGMSQPRFKLMAEIRPGQPASKALVTWGRNGRAINGVAIPAEGAFYLKETLVGLSMLKTCLHEIAHIKCNHHGQTPANEREADSIAYGMLAKLLPRDYSFAGDVYVHKNGIFHQVFTPGGSTHFGAPRGSVLFNFVARATYEKDYGGWKEIRRWDD